MSEKTKEEILLAIRTFEHIVDAHEHLAPERDRLAMKPDVCFLFSHYLTGTLSSAGFTVKEKLNRGRVREFLLDTRRPVEERFAVLERYLPVVRHSAYAEAMWRALREVYGFDDITRDNYMEITGAMRAENKPGLYDRILAERCHIRYALTQQLRTDYEKPFMVPVLNFTLLVDFPEGRKSVEKRAANLGATVNVLDDYIDYCRAQLRHWRDKERVVGMKTVSTPYQEPPARQEAAALFARLMNEGRLEHADALALNTYLREEVIRLCGEEDLTVAVHAGVWDDFRKLDPRHNIPLFIKYPETRFDLYHMGMPWVRDSVFCVGNWSNVYANWCWTHIVSFYMTQSAMLEYVDFVPANKVSCFGGDYSAPTVEKVVGHLRMAQENVATVLARLVDDRRMTVDQAIDVAHQWFWENPKRLYRLDRLG